jgi:hypothetical protein
MLLVDRVRKGVEMLDKLLLATLIGMSSAFAQPMRGRIDVPVMIGSDPDRDTCPSSGTVMGLNPRGDGFLSVRSGPGGSQFREIDRIYNGMSLAICDQVGPWLAVVYTNDGRITCNVSTGWARRQPYTGPCRYGWVHSRYVGDLAG